MHKALAAVLSLAFGTSLAYAAAVKAPEELEPERLAQYDNKCRNLDRWLQGGQVGPLIKNGKGDAQGLGQP